MEIKKLSPEHFIDFMQRESRKEIDACSLPFDFDKLEAWKQVEMWILTYKKGV